MESRKKVKFVIALSLLLFLTLIVVSVFQTVNIIKTKNEIKRQEQTIHQLQQQLEYFENKQPDSNFEIIS